MEGRQVRPSTPLGGNDFKPEGMRKVGGHLLDEQFKEVESIEEEDGDEEMDNGDEMTEVAA